MDFTFAPEDEAFRLELRSWLAANTPSGLPVPGVGGDRHDPKTVEAMRAWQRKLYDAGYVGNYWPVEYGGRGDGVVRQLIFQEEMARAHAPGLINSSAIDMFGPTIMAQGTEEQKRRLLPPILTAEELWCQGFSEPNAGSDLAGLQTRADLDGDEFVVNGTKIWNGGAETATYCVVLLRTDQNVPKHRGISYLIVPMKAPGITVHRVRQMTGHWGFNQIFFDNVRVPRNNLIGEMNKGWYIAQNTLGFERGTSQLSLYMGYKRNFDQALERAREGTRNGAPTIKDPIIRQKVAGAYMDLTIMQLNGYRMLTTMLRGGSLSSEVSPAKVHWGLTDQRVHDLAMEIEGPFGQLFGENEDASERNPLAMGFLASRAATIYGGTGQIQRNIIAERLLGMPR